MRPPELSRIYFRTGVKRIACVTESMRDTKKIGRVGGSAHLLGLHVDGQEIPMGRRVGFRAHT